MTCPPTSRYRYALIFLFHSKKKVEVKALVWTRKEPFRIYAHRLCFSTCFNLFLDLYSDCDLNFSPTSWKRQRILPYTTSKCLAGKRQVIFTQGFVFTIVHVCSLYKFCVYVHITNHHDIT